MNETFFKDGGAAVSEKAKLKGLRRTSCNIGIALFVYNLVSYASMHLFAVLAKWFIISFTKLNAHEVLNSSSFRWLAVLLCQDGAGVLAFWIVSRFSKPTVLKSAPKKRITFEGGCAIFVLCIAIMQIGSYISAFLSDIAENIRGVPLENELSSLVFESNIFLVLIMAVIIGPIIEEFIYRKFIITHLRVYGEKFALVCSAALFALAHGNFYQVFYSFGVGLVFGYLYIKTNDIKINIFYHMAVNFTGTVVPFLFMRAGVTDAGVSGVRMIFNLMYLFLLFILTGAGILFAFLYAKKISFKKMPFDDISARKRIFAFVFNIGMILTFLTIAVNFAMSF